jgi:N-acetylglutamate synthase-like GNAT family acetyltransferase
MKFEYIMENDFRKTVEDAVLNGNFKNDPHKMCVDFKRNKNTIAFFGVKMVNDQEQVIGFCGLDVFQTRDKICGFIHCLGVCKPYRGNGYSVILLNRIENYAKSKMHIDKILSTCNPISTKSHLKAGYTQLDNGRITKTGKIMQIHLEKIL